MEACPNRRSTWTVPDKGIAVLLNGISGFETKIEHLGV